MMNNTDDCAKQKIRLSQTNKINLYHTPSFNIIHKPIQQSMPGYGNSHYQNNQSSQKLNKASTVYRSNIELRHHNIDKLQISTFQKVYSKVNLSNSFINQSQKSKIKNLNLNHSFNRVSSTSAIQPNMLSNYQKKTVENTFLRFNQPAQNIKLFPKQEESETNVNKVQFQHRNQKKVSQKLEKQERLKQIQSLKKQLEEIDKKIKHWNKQRFQGEMMTQMKISSDQDQKQNSQISNVLKMQKQNNIKKRSFFFDSAQNQPKSRDRSNSFSQSDSSSSPQGNMDWGKQSGRLNTQSIKKSKIQFESKVEIHHEHIKQKQSYNSFFNCFQMKDQIQQESLDEVDENKPKSVDSLKSQPELDYDFLDQDDEDFDIIQENQQEQKTLRSSSSTSCSADMVKDNKQSLELISSKPIFKKKKVAFADEDDKQGYKNSPIKISIFGSKNNKKDTKIKQGIRGSLKVQTSKNDFDQHPIKTKKIISYQFEAEDKISKNDFIIIKNLGKTKFGTELLVSDKKIGLVCTMLVISKKTQILEAEKDNLLFQIKTSLINKKNFQNLYGLFDDQSNIYLLLEFCSYENNVNLNLNQNNSQLIEFILEAFVESYQLQVDISQIDLEDIIMSNGVLKIKCLNPRIKKVKNDQSQNFDKLLSFLIKIAQKKGSTLKGIQQCMLKEWIKKINQLKKKQNINLYDIQTLKNKISEKELKKHCASKILEIKNQFENLLK